MNVNEFVCFLCTKILKQPIRLELCSCQGLNVCKEHLVGVKKRRSSFECPKCQFVYDVPFSLSSLSTLENDVLRKAIENFSYLDSQEREIKSNLDNLIARMESTCFQFYQKIDEFSLTQADHFENVRGDIDIRRESLIQDLLMNRSNDENTNETLNELHSKSSEMIRRVELFENEFRQNFDKNVNSLQN